MTGRGRAAPARALVGGGVALALARARPGGARWQRTNYRGEQVSLTSGPALALGLVAGGDLPLAAAAAAGLACAAIGGYDDVAGGRAAQASAKGLRGHATALRNGQVTTGAVKVVGIGAAGLAAAWLLPGRRPLPDVLLGGAVVAGSANLVNLLDLRPGRALKVGLATCLALGMPGAGAATAALLPDDLGERAMLGDAGANALGAVLGLAYVARGGRAAIARALVVLAGLTAASEYVSFTRVIESTPPLRWVDGLGRRQ